MNTDPNATNVAATMATYFSGINSRNYMQAWDVYTSSLQAAVPFDSWSSALTTTQNSQIAVQSIQHNPDGNLDAVVTFQSNQAPQYGPNPGETCTNWSLNYQLVTGGSTSSGSAAPAYLINDVTDAGAGHTAC